MKLIFEIFPKEGRMAVSAMYERKEIKKPYFYLNRDVVIESVLCDGVNTIIKTEDMEHPYAWSGYIAKKLYVPTFANTFEISYSLSLSGQTGSYPYVREKITPEFTLIRYETFCYPLFYDNSHEFWNPSHVDCAICLIIPNHLIWVSSEKQINVDELPGDRKQITFISHEKAAGVFSCAIAPYKRVDYIFGSIYFLPPGKEQAVVEEFITKAHEYMNKHFGYRQLPQSITFAAIPTGFGSFARPGAIFIQESTFDSISNMNQIIHEFIHLGWNAAPKTIAIQRSRFFDEAFTSYFEHRVMRHLLNDDSISARRTLPDKFPDIPISKYGEHECGEYSYTIGAFMLEQLCALLGQAAFDAAISAFLEEHTCENAPADFEDFCNIFKLTCPQHKPALEHFFQSWLYNTP